jgi:hypothetical protein
MFVFGIFRNSFTMLLFHVKKDLFEGAICENS